MNVLMDIVVSFGKIGVISLGGGNAMIKLLQYETVNYRQWMGQEEFFQLVGSTFLFPGLTGVKLAGLIGYKAAGVLGMLLAVLCLNLPGLILAFLGYKWLSNNDDPLMKKIMIAVQYGSVALLAAATFSMLQGVIDISCSWPVLVACSLFFLALTFGQLSPFWGFLAFIGICTVLIR